LALVSVFLLLIPLLTTSTLFPYTTLFRSYLDIAGIGDDADNLVPLRSSLAVRGNAHAFSNDVQRAPIFAGHRFVDHDDSLRALLDRKSTRLNSSHRTISYAVFCLKKKMYQ